MKSASPIPRGVLRKFLLGFDGVMLPEDLRDLLVGGLSGVALFHRNFKSSRELRQLTDEMRAVSPDPLLIGVDQEGGAKFALPEPFTQWPSPTELGHLGDPAAVEAVAKAMARELVAAGCNLNFAPMLDLHLHPRSPVTTDRSFGADPVRVGEFGAAFVRGLEAEGVLACAKHFPGHGDATVDPHLDLPIFDDTLERLRAMELVPFARVIGAGVPLVMTAHILLPWIDPIRPATLSARVVRELLRREMNFNGVVLADDLGMGAIARRFPSGAAAVETFRAGCDVAMLLHDWTSVAPGLTATAKAFHDGVFEGREWDASETRIAELLERAARARTNAYPLDVIGCPEHRALAREIRSRLRRSEAASAG